MPDKLLINTKSRFLEYFSIEMFKYSLVTIKNSFSHHINDDEKKYLIKGMRYYKEYLLAEKDGKLFDNYVYKNVTLPKASWLTNNYTDSKFEKLKNIVLLLQTHKIDFIIYTNPILHKQIKESDNFLVQLNLVEKIVKEIKIPLYDFNNINNVNLNDKYFIDVFHFNYTVADCIVEKLINDSSKCGTDFGQKIDMSNIDNYKSSIIDKYHLLKNTN